MLGRGALADPGLAPRVAAELGLRAGPPIEEATGIDWLDQLRRLAARTPGFDGKVHGRTVHRFKQWLGMAAACGTFGRFDAVKTARSADELFAVLGAARRQPAG